MTFLGYAFTAALQICAGIDYIDCTVQYIPRIETVIISVCQDNSRNMTNWRKYVKDGKTVIITMGKQCHDA